MAGTVQQSAYIVEERLEETPGAPVFWNESLEVFTAINEAMCEITLLVGRPTQLFNVVYSVSANTPWQPMPAGMLCITDIQGPSSLLWKRTLRDMDYIQSAWGPDWENDVSSTQVFTAWWPMGFTFFGIWPSVPLQPQNVTLSGVQSPIQSTWPFSGTQVINWHDEFFQAIEKYAAHYLRIKESGTEMQDSMALYESFMDDMKRLTTIEDRRDPYIFTRGYGAAADRGQTPDQR